jgi:hypothetical protein
MEAGRWNRNLNLLRTVSAFLVLSALSFLPSTSKNILSASSLQREMAASTARVGSRPYSALSISYLEEENEEEEEEVEEEEVEEVEEEEEEEEEVEEEEVEEEVVEEEEVEEEVVEEEVVEEEEVEEEEVEEEEVEEEVVEEDGKADQCPTFA